MKCAILQTADNNYQELISITSPINRKYAEHYEVDYILDTQSYTPDRHPSWNKISATLKLFLTNKYDYIFFLDGDAMIIDITRNIFDLGKANPDIMLHLCGDGVQARKLDNNFGTFLVKNDRVILQFFEKVLYSPAFKGDSQYEEHFFYKNRNWEQSIIQYEFAQAELFYSKIVKIYDSDAFNHYNGDWVYHPCIGDWQPDSIFEGWPGGRYTKNNDWTLNPADELKAKMLKEKISQLSLDQKIYTSSDSLSSEIFKASGVWNNVTGVVQTVGVKPNINLSNVSNISPRNVSNISQQPRDYFE